jgi:hypothetical protein
MPASARSNVVSDGSEIFGYSAGGGGIVLVIAKFIWDSVKGRKDQLEKQVETSAKEIDVARDAKMDAVLSKLGTMELDMRSLLEKHATQIGAIAEVKNRVEGISTNHGGRLGTIEQALVELRTRLISVESQPSKRK